MARRRKDTDSLCRNVPMPEQSRLTPDFLRTDCFSTKTTAGFTRYTVKGRQVCHIHELNTYNDKGGEIYEEQCEKCMYGGYRNHAFCGGGVSPDSGIWKLRLLHGIRGDGGFLFLHGNRSGHYGMYGRHVPVLHAFPESRRGDMGDARNDVRERSGLHRVRLHDEARMVMERA